MNNFTLKILKKKRHGQIRGMEEQEDEKQEIAKYLILYILERLADTANTALVSINCKLMCFLLLKNIIC